MPGQTKRKKRLDDPGNPRILTLDETFAIADAPAANDFERRTNTAKAVRALADRAGCRCKDYNNAPHLGYGERIPWIWLYSQGDILNGGFSQYLTNSAADRAEEVKGYLRAIGAKATLKIFSDVSKLFPDGVIPGDRSQRDAIIRPIEQSIMSGANDIFDQWDDRFYNLPEDVNALIIAYAKKHRSDFAEPRDELVNQLRTHREFQGYYRRSGYNTRGPIA
jgi:hypothetical protein